MALSEAHPTESSLQYPSLADVHKRLRLAKAVLSHAVDHSLQPGLINKVIAVHGLHYSLEILLRTIFWHWHLDIPWNKDRFKDLWEMLDNSARERQLNVRLPYKDEAFQLNLWRNQAQHHTSGPPDDLLAASVAFVPRFLRQVTLEFLGIDLDRVTELDLIDNDHIKALLKKADECRRAIEQIAEPSSGEDEAYRPYQTALAILGITFAVAFGESKAYVGRSAYDRLVEVPLPLLVLDADGAPAHLWRRTRELELATLFSVLGVDYWAYQELVEHAPDVAIDQYQQPWIIANNEANPDARQLQRLIDFETALVLDWLARGIIRTSTAPGNDAFRLTAETILQGEQLLITGIDDFTNVQPVMTMNLGAVMLQGYRQYESYLTGSL